MRRSRAYRRWQLPRSALSRGLFRLSMLVRLISDSILVGFKAGAGLTIMMTQLPSLFGVAGGGRNFFDRLATLVGQLGAIHWGVLAFGLVAILLLLLGERRFPGRPVATGGRHPVDHCGNGTRPVSLRHSGYRSDPEGPSEFCPADLRAAGVRRIISARRRHPAARLYRRRVRRAKLCGQARLSPST